MWTRILSLSRLDASSKYGKVCARAKHDLLEDIRCEEEGWQDKKARPNKSWAPVFDPNAFDQEHKPLELAQYALRATELKKYATLAVQIRNKFLEKTKAMDDCAAEGFAYTGQERKSTQILNSRKYTRKLRGKKP